MKAADNRVAWIVGLVAAAAAAVGITMAVTSKASTPNQPAPNPNPTPPPPPPPPPPPNPPPPNPPPPNPPPPPPPVGTTWIPAVSIDPGKTYRISVPGDPVSTGIIAQLLNPTAVAGIYPPGSSLPSDWPQGDNDPSRWRAQFVNTTGASIPVPQLPSGAGVYIYVAT